MEIYNQKYGQNSFFDEIWAKQNPEEAEEERKKKVKEVEKEVQ